jgi:hypothetical protein
MIKYSKLRVKSMRAKRALLKKIVIGVGVLFGVVIIGFLFYVNDYYKATDDVDEWINLYSELIEENKPYTIIHSSIAADQQVGLIFYPGGKVEANAYIPLLVQLAEQGVTSVLVEMPFKLAVFNINAADKVYSLLPKVESWYLVGHSLGGAMASSYVGNNYEKLDGLILLAAYPINEAPIATIQIYGSNDLVLDQDKISSEVTYLTIEGGNHAYFGNYGDQEGDGVSTISREQQQIMTVEQIMIFINKTRYE